MSRLHYLLAKHGWHPGRTDDDIIDILDAKIAAVAAQPAEPTTAEGLTRWALCPETDTPCSVCPTQRIPCEAAQPPAQPVAWHNPRADRLREALKEIAETGNLTATPAQFARHLQRVAERALTEDAMSAPQPPQAGDDARDAERYRMLCECREWPEYVDAAFDTAGHKVAIDEAVDLWIAAAKGKA